MPDEFGPLVRDNDDHRFNLRIELGANASLERIANCVDAVRDLLDLGERWAIVFAHEAAARSLVAEMMLDEENSSND